MTTETNSVLNTVKEAFAPVTEALKNLQNMEVPEAAREFVKKTAGTAKERAADLHAGSEKVTAAIETAVTGSVSEAAKISRNIQQAIYQDTEAFFAGPDLGLTLVRPARKDETTPRYFPNWLRQRVEAIIWTLKHQLGLERHGGRVPAGLWARIVQRLLALNAAIWHNWAIGAPVKRSLIAYDH